MLFLLSAVSTVVSQYPKSPRGNVILYGSYCISANKLYLNLYFLCN